MPVPAGHSKGGLSSGAQAGIAIGVIVAVVGLGVAGAALVKARRKHQRLRKRAQSGVSTAWGGMGCQCPGGLAMLRLCTHGLPCDAEAVHARAAL